MSLDRAFRDKADYAADAELVERIRERDPEAMARLYAMMERIYLPKLRRRIYQDAADKLHDAYVLVLDLIQRGKMRDGARIRAVIAIIVARETYHKYAALMRDRETLLPAEMLDGLPLSSADPEQIFAQSERKVLGWKCTRVLGNRDAEILRRFYGQEQSPEQICREMNLTETQYRLLKSRAVKRAGERAKAMAA